MPRQLAAAGSGVDPAAEGTNHGIWVLAEPSDSWVSLGGQAVGGVGAAGLN